MKSRFIAVQRYYKGNVIDGYAIQDITNGAIKEFKSDKLKSLIASGRMNVANLKLTSDGKLRLSNNSELYSNNMDIDGKTDNNEKIRNSTHDEIVYELLKQVDRYSNTMKVKNFNKNTNTFVLRFSSSKMINKSVEILFKYNVDTGYGVYIRLLPLAIRFNNCTYDIENLPEDCAGRLSISESDLFFIKDDKASPNMTAIIETRDKFIKTVYSLLVNIILNDPKTAEIIQKTKTKDDIENLMRATQNISDTEITMASRKGFLFSSAVTYSVFCALIIGQHDPATTAIVTATAGSFLNAFIQFLRTTFVNYEARY